MIKKISRDICLIKYRKFPLCEFDKKIEEDICYFPKINSLYWLKLDDNSESKLILEIVSLIRKLNVKKSIFMSERNQKWISKSTEKRKDFEPLTKAVEYFKSHKIEKKFNGGVKVGNEELNRFLENIYTLTKCDGGFFDFNFIDKNENYIFYIHYSGELKVLTLNENANQNFLKIINETKFVDSMRENTNRIK